MESSPINVNIYVKNNDYTVSIHTVTLQSNDTINTLKNIIETLFGTNNYLLSFYNKPVVDTQLSESINHPLSHYLIRDGSRLELYRRDIEYNISSPPHPPVLKRSINENKWNRGHLLAYYLDKIIIIEKTDTNIFIITPNGTRYDGFISETLLNLQNDGYSQGLRKNRA